MPPYVTPGTYQAAPPLLPDIRLVRTDIAGFFGFAERGEPPDPDETDPGKRAQAAVKVTSWSDFRMKFGGFLPYSYLAYAVRGFFATGGQTCYVVRVGVAADPPATAAIPLPAAVTSHLFAQLAEDIPAAQMQIQFNAPVPEALSIGASLSIGDPALNQWLRVESVIDSQTITIEYQTKPNHYAGEPVFALSGPAVATPVTSIVAATVAGQSRIQLDCSQVQGIEQGSLIAIGDPVAGECVAVSSVIDDQTIIVQPPLTTPCGVGDPVYAVAGSAVTSVEAGRLALRVDHQDDFSPGDLVSVEADGRHELRMVTAALSDSRIQFGRALEAPVSTGALTRKYAAALLVSAVSEGTWGNRIKLEITPLEAGNAVTHFSLRVTGDRGSDPMQPIEQEFYPLLSLNPNDPSPTPIYAPDVVNQSSSLIRLDPQSKLPGTFLLVNSGPLRSNELYLEGGSDGAPPASRPDQPPDAGNQDFLNALDVLGMVEEVAILCCPDAAAAQQQPPVGPGWSMATIQQAMIAQCVRLRYRVAVLDTPMSLRPAKALEWLEQQGYPDAAGRFAAMYYPWLKVPDQLGTEGPNRRVPPCGHIAGAYAYTDNESGVQKPPANVELHFISDVELAVTNQQQGFLNSSGINAIRPIPGRGIRVWGAQAVSREPDWNFIHTRRLMSMIEDSVEQASRWVVFQDNNDDVRRTLTHSLNVFLESIRLTGGLKGLRAADSYFVKCDRTNNPPAAIDAGQLVCQIGVAIAAPMEFLVFELRRSVAGAQVEEA